MAGSSTFIIRFVDDKLTVIVLINGTASPNSIAVGVAGFYIPGITLASIKPGRDPHPDLTQRLKQCLHELAAKKDSEILTAQFRTNFARSVRRHGDLTNHLTHVKSFKFVVSETQPDGAEDRLGARVAKTCSYKLVSPQGQRFYTFELTHDNKVAWLQSSAN